MQETICKILSSSEYVSVSESVPRKVVAWVRLRPFGITPNNCWVLCIHQEGLYPSPHLTPTFPITQSGWCHYPYFTGGQQINLPTGKGAGLLAPEAMFLPLCFAAFQQGWPLPTQATSFLKRLQVLQDPEQPLLKLWKLGEQGWLVPLHSPPVTRLPKAYA